MSRLNFTLSDGRNLEYMTNGVEGSKAIILHAGTTQDISGWTTWHENFAARGIRSISFGRSGYCASTKMPGRVTIDVARDISELADALGVEAFVNIGLSGGGQHAVATGLDPKSRGVVTVGSLAPFAELGEDFYRGMQQVDIDEYGDALRDINNLVKRFQTVLTQVPGPESLEGLSPQDLAAQSKRAFKVHQDSTFITIQNGWDWVADDYSSYLNPWGFDPRDVKVPVVIWQGGLDRNVPVVHGEWLRDHVAESRYELRPDESHIGIFVNYEEEIIERAAQLLG
jgi:pimeloyl-ACP methyl ester carboxylesterase